MERETVVCEPLETTNHSVFVSCRDSEETEEEYPPGTSLSVVRESYGGLTRRRENWYERLIRKKVVTEFSGTCFRDSL